MEDEFEFRPAAPTTKMLDHLKSRQMLEDAIKEQGLQLILGPESLLSYTSRIIVARNGDVSGSVAQIKEHMNFLRQVDIERLYRMGGQSILECPSEKVNEFYPLYIKGFDKFGHSCVFAKVGKIDIKSILKITSGDRFVLYHTWLRERMFRMRDLMVTENPAFVLKEFNVTHSQYTVVIDFAGAGLSQVGSTFYDMMKQTSHIDQMFYPERVFRIIAINTPWLFNVVWKAVKNFMDKDTLAKFKFCSTNYVSEIAEVINLSELPQDYGGTLPPITDQDHISHVTERFYCDRDQEILKSKELAEKRTVQTMLPGNLSAMEPNSGQEMLKETAENMIIQPIRRKSAALIEQLSPHTRIRRPIISVPELKLLLLKEFLVYENTEREILLENQYLRAKIASWQENSPSKIDPELRELNQRTINLQLELKSIMQKTGQYQLAINFAKNYMENVDKKDVVDNERFLLGKEIERLRSERFMLVESIEERFGPGSVGLILQPRHLVS